MPYAFQDPLLLAQAFRHRSSGDPNNERLEFLGDSVVNLFIAEALYQRWPYADEGALTRARAQLVRKETLASVARRLQLHQHLVLGPGEMKSGGYRRDSILADTFEALVAAIYLDAGFVRCQQIVLPWFEEDLQALQLGKLDKDPKTRLQEWLQARRYGLPVYSLTAESGEDHAKHFFAECSLPELNITASGDGASRRYAEQKAAEALMKHLEAKR